MMTMAITSTIRITFSPRRTDSLGGPPPSGRIAGGQDDPQRPVDIPRPGKHRHRGDGVDEEYGRLVHVDPDEVHVHQVPQRRDHEETDAHLVQPADETDPEHDGIDEPSAGGLPGLPPVLPGGGDEDRGDHDEDEDAEHLLKEEVVHFYGRDGPEDRPRKGACGEPHARLQVRIVLPPVGDDGGDALDEDGQAVGAVGKGAVETQEDEHREGDGRTPAGHDVQKPGDDSDDEQQGEQNDLIHLR